MKKILGLFAASALVACSSGTGSGNTVQPPPSKTFTYGAGTAPTATQQTAENDASTQSNNVVVAATSGNTATAASAPDLATSITTEALPAAMAPMPTQHLASAMAKAKDGLRGGALQTGCYTETTNTLTYSHCDCSGGQTGYTCSINGTLTASNDNVTWSITIDISYSSSGVSETATGTESGNITVTPTSTTDTINGFAKEAISATANGNGTSDYFAYTAEVDFLTLVFDSTCNSTGDFTSGQLEARRTVATSGNYDPGITNAGVLFTWTGCGTYTVATGT